jgi:hypothetical protein
MSAFIALTATLAQAASPVPTPAPASAPATEAPKVGESTYLDIEGGGGYSSNPNLSLNSSTGSAFGRIALHAVHSRISERATTLLSAYAEELGYANHHGSQQSLSVNARHDAAVSEKLRLFGDLSATYDKGGQLDTRIVGVPSVPPLPGTPGLPPSLLPPGSDFLSVTGRTYTLAANAGGQLALSPHDSFSLSSGVERVVFKSRSSNTSYWTIPASLSYDRVLSPRTTIGARLVFAATDYSGPSNFRVITPQLTARVLLTERLIFSGAIGASFARVDDGMSIRHSTGLSAEGNLCSRGERGQFCARAAVDQTTPTVAGPARSITGSVDYSRRLDVDSTIQFSLSASHYSSPTSIISGQTFSRSTYYRAAGAYTRRISNRWFGGVNLAGRKLTEQGPDPKADLMASLFIRYRLGDVQ